MPTPSEAALLAEVRCEVADVVGLEIGYATAEAVLSRYAELMAQKNGNRAAPERVATLVQAEMFC
jgi:hypothetical protein